MPTQLKFWRKFWKISFKELSYLEELVIKFLSFRVTNVAKKSSTYVAHGLWSNLWTLFQLHRVPPNSYRPCTFDLAQWFLKDPRESLSDAMATTNLISNPAPCSAPRRLVKKDATTTSIGKKSSYISEVLINRKKAIT